MSEKSRTVEPGMETEKVEATNPTRSTPEELLMEVQRVSGWILPPVATREQMVELGRENLLCAQKVLRQILAKARPIRKKQQEMLKLLDGRTVEQLQKIAQRYDCPQYHTRHSIWQGEEKRPDDDEVKSRAAGSTTLQICGWCKYAVPYCQPYVWKTVPGEQRVFRPSCGFYHSQWNSDYEHDFDTPCLLTRSQARIDEVCQQLQERHWEFMQYYDKLARCINYLSVLIAEAEPKPLLPEYRALCHYAVGTPVYYFSGAHKYHQATPPYPFGHSCAKLTYDIWRGRVVGHVKSETFSSVQVLFEGQKEPTGLESANEALVSFEELAYLVNHPYYAQIWLTCSGGRSNMLVADAVARYYKNRYLSLRVR